MKRPTFLIAALATLLGFVACHTTDVPVGTPGTVQIRVYIDADGSGTFTADDDQVLTGVGVTLTSASGVAAGATTDVQGIATFENVAPGAYTAALAGTTPSGQVLATAPALTVVVPFQGGTVSPQFRFAEIPGSINGLMYRDDNGNGSFDAGIDTPAPGLTVTLYAGADASGTPIATTSTQAGGDFHFNTLRPGVYTIVVTPIPTIQLTGGNVRTVTVGPAAVATPTVKFTGNLLIPISAVRTSAVGSTVAFEGTATVNAGVVGTNQLYVQDANTGVLVFGAPTAGTVAGDVVRIIGVVAIFNGELEIVAPAGGALLVTKLSSGTPPSPRTITATQLIANTFAGQLVTVTNVKVTSVVTTGATSYNVNFQGNTPADVFQVRVGNTNTVPILSTFWQVGRAYDVTGLDGVFNGLAQLKPRSSADVVVGALILGIAQARTHPALDTVQVEGVVYLGTGVLTQLTAANLNAYIQDGTGGALIFNIPTGTIINAGDSIRVKGLVAFFSGEYEIARFTSTSPPVIDRLGTGTIIPARVTTGVELASKAFDGQFIKMIQFQVLTVGTPSGTGAYNVTGTALDGTPMTVRIDQSTVGIPNTTWTVGSKYDVSGAALNFVSGSTTTPEMKPRNAGDVVPHP